MNELGDFRKLHSTDVVFLHVLLKLHWSELGPDGVEKIFVNEGFLFQLLITIVFLVNSLAVINQLKLGRGKVPLGLLLCFAANFANFWVLLTRYKIYCEQTVPLSGPVPSKLDGLLSVNAVEICIFL